jgi:hypothetical protein
MEPEASSENIVILKRRKPTVEPAAKPAIESERAGKRPTKIGKNGKEEDDRQRAAFKYYVKLGEKRSYSRVALHFNVHAITVGNWARIFDWESRLYTALQTIEKREFNRTVSSVSGIMSLKKVTTVKEIMEGVDNLFAHIKRYNRMARKYNKNLKPGDKPMVEKMLINDLGDIEQGFRIAMILSGEATSKTEQIITNVSASAVKSVEELLESNEEARELLARLYRMQFQIVESDVKCLSK